LVTGAGSGLGRAVCRVLAEDGVCVVSADLREEASERTAEDVRRMGGTSTALPLDVGDPRQSEDAVRRVLEAHGRVDMLINNAGVDVTLAVDEIAVADWERVIRTNLIGPFLMSRAVLAPMKAQGHGHIVNVVSTAAKRVWANASAYHASKWGLLGFSHALHVEARPYHIKVTAVVCGGMRTPFLLDRFPDIDQRNLQDADNVARAIRFALTQPEETVIPELMVLPMRETSWP